MRQPIRRWRLFLAVSLALATGAGCEGEPTRQAGTGKTAEASPAAAPAAAAAGPVMASGIPCVDVPAKGHALLAKKPKSGGRGGGGGKRDCGMTMEWCRGACRNLSYDADNCGRCGHKCEFTSCWDGVCQ